MPTSSSSPPNTRCSSPAIVSLRALAVALPFAITAGPSNSRGLSCTSSSTYASPFSGVSWPSLAVKHVQPALEKMDGDRRLQINQLINGNDQHPPGNNNARLAPLINGTHTNGRAPEVYRFVENDHTYYAYRNSCVYPFPCDEGESARLDMLHSAIYDVALGNRLITDDTILSSTPRPQVLDVGYGTGIWAYEMGKKYPNVDVVGIDLYNNQPPRHEAVPNASFLTPVDFTQSYWGVREGSFDLIHMSQLLGCVPDWAQHYTHIFRYLKPETGWVEHVEIDWKPRYDEERGMPPTLAPLQLWWDCMIDASAQLRKSIAYREDTEKLLFKAGFRDISHKIVQVPLGCTEIDNRTETMRRWFKTIMRGDVEQNMKPTFVTMSMSLFTRQLHMQPSDAMRLCEGAQAAYFSNREPLHQNIHIWTARKPKS